MFSFVKRENILLWKQNRNENKKTIKNRVHFDELRCVKVRRLISGKKVYIFDDGRKDGLTMLSTLNNLKYNVRVPYSEELDEFVRMKNIRIEDC